MFLNYLERPIDKSCFVYKGRVKRQERCVRRNFSNDRVFRIKPSANVDWQNFCARVSRDKRNINVE